MVTNKVTSDMMSAKALGKKAMNEIISSRLSNPRTTCILDPIKNICKHEKGQNTAQKIKFSIKDFFSKCDQILRKLWIWSHLLKKSLIQKLFRCELAKISLLK